MSKNSNHKGALEAPPEKTREYISSQGVKAILHGVPPLEVTTIYNSVEYPPRPTYKIETASGEVQEFPHDETTLVTDEDKQAWDNYKSLSDLADNQLTELMLNEVLIEGIEVELSGAKFELWKRKQKLKGITLPDDELELSLMYKRSTVACSSDEINLIMEAVMELTGVDRSRLDAAKKSFPDSVESIT